MLLPSSVLMVLAIASRKWVGVDSLGASTAVEGVPVLLGPVFPRTKENHIFPTCYIQERSAPKPQPNTLLRLRATIPRTAVSRASPSCSSLIALAKRPPGQA